MLNVTKIRTVLRVLHSITHFFSLFVWLITYFLDQGGILYCIVRLTYRRPSEIDNLYYNYIHLLYHNCTGVGIGWYWRTGVDALVLTCWCWCAKAQMLVLACWGFDVLVLLLASVSALTTWCWCWCWCWQIDAGVGAGAGLVVGVDV